MAYKQLQNKIQTIVNQIVKKYHPEKIILFGSLVAGKTHKWSDADLIVVKSTNKKFSDRIGEVSSIVDHDLPIDFLVYTPNEFAKMSSSNYFMRDEILKKGKVLYEQ